MEKYDKILEDIFSAYPMYHKIGSAAYKEGLENIGEVLDVIGNPHDGLRCIHVAGTNGKGSVSAILASYFQELGMKTGLFTSPHLIDFRERIRINGEMISEETVVAFFDKFNSRFSKIEPSFFEITTALAFYHFATEKTDIAIIEVGLGGRLDATNVISPLISVITNISLEHTQMLGDSIAKIAREKAGIIKRKTPVVVGEFHPESFPVFEDIANSLESPLFLADGNFSARQADNMRHVEILDNDKTVCTIDDNPLRGEYQIKNIVTAYQTAKVAEFLLNIREDVFAKATRNVVNNTHICGRWQVLAKNPTVICDVAHNPAGIAYGMKNIAKEKMSSGSEIHVVFGMVKDKDIDTVTKLLDKDFSYHVCSAHIERALNPMALAGKMEAAGFKCQTCDSVEQAVEAALSGASENDLVFITGSCFVVGEAMQLFMENKKGKHA